MIWYGYQIDVSESIIIIHHGIRYAVYVIIIALLFTDILLFTIYIAHISCGMSPHYSGLLIRK